jgi:crotonobetainyl-CoA:carnitine CoA-transferase CaiB-like acyl-CoA transferase
MLESDRYWAHFCADIGRPELAADPRFTDSVKRTANRAECTEVLAGIFRTKTLVEWKPILSKSEAVWSIYQTPLEMLDDPQVVANGYTAVVDSADGGSYRTTNSPIQFNEIPAQPRRAPQFCEHTEEVLLDMGLTWEEIGSAREQGIIG